MSFNCEIIITDPKIVYITGQTVSGFIKFTITRDARTYKNITVTLKGKGELYLVDKWSRKNSASRHKSNFELFEDIKDTSLELSGHEFKKGTYSIPFSFGIPEDIPPTFAYIKSRGRYRVKCRIKHYIQALFNAPHLLLGETQKFQKELYIIAGVKPRVRSVPLIYGKQKRIYGTNCRQENIIKIKTNIEQSVLTPGSKVKFSYEVTNNSNINILSVRVQLVEALMLGFTILNRSNDANKLKILNKTSDLLLRSGKILRGSKHSECFEIDLPKTASSVDFSKIIRRDYHVHICVVLPCLRKNLYLEMPVLVDAKSDNSITNLSNRIFLKSFKEQVTLYES